MLLTGSNSRENIQNCHLPIAGDNKRTEQALVGFCLIRVALPESAPLFRQEQYQINGSPLHFSF